MAPTKSDSDIVLAFDAYGTLFSTQSIAEKLAAHFGEAKAQVIATTWRRYQLEYTWRLNSMGQYEDFSAVTRRSLKHALSESAVELNALEVDEMMLAYDSLSCFPDVEKCLQTVKATPGIRAVVFSNGTYDMVANLVANSPAVVANAEALDDVVVVEDVRRFKPAPEAYRHVARSVGKDIMSKEDMTRLWLVSSNPFDVVGARAVGMNAVWVDRAGHGWQDSLVEGDEGRSTLMMKSLEPVVTAVMERHTSKL